MCEQWVTVALEEYKTLRQEALGAIEQMQRTLHMGLVAIGVLTAFGVDAVRSGRPSGSGHLHAGGGSPRRGAAARRAVSGG